MNTELDKRQALMKRIEEADDSELLQLSAFVKGYEACKANQTAETNTQVSQTNPETFLHH